MILLNAVLLATTVACIEGFLRSPFLRAVRELGGFSSRALWVLQARHVSDERKQISLVAYSSRMLVRCLLVLLIIAGLLGFVLLVDWLAALAGVRLLEYLVSPMGIGVSIAISVVYVWARKRLVA